MTARVLFVALAFGACTCKSNPPPPPPPNVPPNLHPPTEESCDRAQETLERLQCRRDDGSPWARTPHGAPFAEACKVALRDGRWWMSNCISRITDCADLIPAFRGEWCGATNDGGAQ